MRKLKLYTKAETERIIEFFATKPNAKQKEVFAKEMERPVSVLQQKALYENSKLSKRKKKVSSSNETVIKVTQLKKEIVTNPVITIGDASITIPTRKFIVGGIQIEC